VLGLVGVGATSPAARADGGADAPAPAVAPAEGTTAADFRRIVREAKDRVFPATVFVKCITESAEEGKKEGAEVSGSGVLITAGGEFLTNWHVVDDAREVRCLLADGRAYRAKILGTDKYTDLALGRLEAPAGAPPFPFASPRSDALVGRDGHGAGHRRSVRSASSRARGGTCRARASTACGSRPTRPSARATRAGRS
jgi:S1-C subfamily serine protease